MVGTKVSRPQIRPLNSAKGTLRAANPAQVSRKTTEAERVIPASQPPRAWRLSVSRFCTKVRLWAGVSAKAKRW